MDAKWLKTQFDNNPSKTKTGLASVLGLEPPAISKILKGQRQIKAQEYIQMCAFFGLENDTNKLKPELDAYTLKPVANSPVFGEPSVENNDDQWRIPAKILNKRTSAPPDQIKIFENTEHLMEPDFRQGEHVLVDMSDKKPSPPGVFLVSDGLGYMVRYCEFIPKSNPPEIKISARHRDFVAQTVDLNDIDLLGRVIAKLQMI